MPYWPVPNGTHAGRGGDGALSLMAPSLRTRVRSGNRRVGYLEHLVLALVAYVPQLWSKPGVADSDIKSYLYLDPGRFLRQSVSMWDPTVGLGTVTHEQAGYLWPVGPFYLAVHALGIPVWVGERLWVGSLLFAAGTGVLFLCRTFGLDGPGRPVAALAFMLSPYFLQDVGRISSLLLPWAGLGWLLASTVRAVRTGGWRYPALFALVWLTISALNASGPIYAVVAPALWLLYVVFVSREYTLGRAWAATWRIVVLTAGVSLWWAWSLLIEGRFGVNILGYTETVAAVAKTSTAFEILRGLGYWFFYGADVGGPWAAPLTGFTQELWLLAVTFAIPVLALAAVALVRWRHRAYFVFLVLVGLVLAVGSHPYVGPSVIGSLIKTFMTKTTAGLALRSSDRATPMVLLGLAVLFGAALTALTRRMRRTGLAMTVLTLVLVATANPAVWNGSTVLSRYKIPTPLPSYVTKAAGTLNASHTQTRVLAIPSENTAAYVYGDTVDPIWPGLLTRPFVTGEQVPLGSLQSYDLLYGLDAPLLSGTADPAALAPMARLMDAGDVLVQNDLAYWLYDRPSPQESWPALDLPQPGLGTAIGFGAAKPNVPSPPVVNDAVLAGSPTAAWPAPLEVLPVSDPRPVVRAESVQGALVVAGDGEGLDAAAGVGLLDTDAPVLYAGTLDTDGTARATTLTRGATLVLTDTNRKELFSWNSVQDNAEPTLDAKAPEPPDTLNIFPRAPTTAQSTAADVGVANVSSLPASADHSAVLAIDGNDATAWQTNIASAASGKWWEVTLTRPVTTDHITIVQAQPGDYEHQRWITGANLSFDGGAPFDVTLGPASHASPGQKISFPSQSFTTLRITITATNLSHASTAVRNSASPVGLAEVGMAGVRAQQVVAMPSDLLDTAGPSSMSHRLVLVMTRQRDNSVPPDSDPEPVLDRSFTLPTRRTFSVLGSASISSEAADDVVDTAVGRPAGVVAYSSSRLPGDPAATASAALDGNSATLWMPRFGAPNQVGAWIQVNTPKPVSVDHLDLQVAADTYHSVPTSLRVQGCDTLTADGRCPADAPAAAVSLPAIHDGTRGTIRTVPVDFPVVRGRDLTITVTGVRLRRTTKPFLLSEPIGIAELGIPGVQVAAAPAAMPGTCRTDLLAVDGTPVPVRVTGSSADALAGRDVPLTLCGADANGLTLGPGRHIVTTSTGAASGLSVDQLAFDSAPGGGVMALSATGASLTAPAGGGVAPAVHVVSQGTTAFTLRVTGVRAAQPFWLVLGQSINKGWKATVDGTGQSLGPPTLIDGFANGWLVHPGHGGTLSFTVQWTPEHTQDLALLVSAAAAVLCVVLAWQPRRRRARAGVGAPVSGAQPEAPAVEDRAELADVGPTLANPFAAARALPPWVALPVGVVCGLVSALLVPPGAFPFVFLGVGAAVFLALLSPPARGIFAVGAVGLAVAAVVYILVTQSSRHYPGNGSWPSQFEAANVLVWVAVLLLAADTVVDLVRRRR